MKSKKPSDAKPPDGSVFFIDRSLGIDPLRIQLTRAGLTVVIHDDHFARDEEDRIWLKAVGERGWIVLTKDQRLRYRPLEVAALRSGGLRRCSPGKLQDLTLATRAILGAHLTLRSNHDFLNRLAWAAYNNRSPCGVQTALDGVLASNWRPNHTVTSLLFSLRAVCKSMIFGAWGARGPEFKSRRPDQNPSKTYRQRMRPRSVCGVQLVSKPRTPARSSSRISSSPVSAHQLLRASLLL